MKPAVYHSMATADLLAAAVYYEKQRPGLGMEFLNEVEEAERLSSAIPSGTRLTAGRVFAFVR